MSIISTEVIAAIAQVVQEETKGNSCPLESAESDPVSLMAEPTSRSFILFIPANGPRGLRYCSREENIFARGKAELVSILLATAPCVQELLRELACRLKESFP